MEPYRCINCGKLLLKHNGSTFEIVCPRCKTKQKFKPPTWQERCDKLYQEATDIIEMPWATYQFLNMTQLAKGFHCELENGLFVIYYKDKVVKLIR